MGRKRNPERNKSFIRYMESGGKILLDDLAAAAGVPKSRISKWKSEDKWEEKLKEGTHKKGGQKGNQNACGRTPAKDGNKNAVTHGAYAQITYEDISPEKANEIQNIIHKPMNSLTHMITELQSLLLRKEYLEGLLEQYTNPAADKIYYIDKIVHMIVPKSLEDIGQEQSAGIEAGEAKDIEGGKEHMKTAMKSIIKASAFDRAMKVEAELNRLHGRIIKQIDSIKAYELEEQRLKLEEKKYALAKQRLTGEIIVDDEDEIIDDGAEKLNE